ncbi:MAG: YIP1 family protein [Planctomycetota bacterium]
MMNPCSYCGRPRLEEGSRCPACGAGAGHPPWDPPAWEGVRSLDPGLSWLRALWGILGNPSGFFSSLPPTHRVFRSWTFALPVVFMLFPVAMLAAHDHLEMIEARQPALLDQLAVVAGMGAWGVFDLAQSLLLMAGYWGVFVAMVATFVHLGLLMTGGAAHRWTATFRLSGYALVPGPLILLLLTGLWLAFDSVRLGGVWPVVAWMRPLAAQGLLWALLAWPFILLVLGVEKIHGIRRGRAISTVLLAMMTGLLVSSLLGL